VRFCIVETQCGQNVKKLVSEKNENYKPTIQQTKAVFQLKSCWKCWETDIRSFRQRKQQSFTCRRQTGMAVKTS